MMIPNTNEDTIVAIATPPGIGAIGVIRLSGNRAIAIGNGFFPSADLSLQSANTLHVGRVEDNGRVIDEVVIGLFKAPRSYTGEDVVEISCHGSPYVLEEVLRLCIEKGARIAKPGEFTLRAFLNGKMDLAQAEAVADLIASNTEASRRTAMQHIRGGFSQELSKLREDLVRFSALIELELDFSQEDVKFADRKELATLISQCKARVKSLLESFRLGNVIKNGIQVVISGKPNAGKSTLLNALVNEQKALVSDIPGTTRDVIEAVINLGGLLFRIIDTAGLREKSGDPLENMGMEKSREALGQADIILYLFDVTEFSQTELDSVFLDLQSRGVPFLLAGNKADLAGDSQLGRKYSAHEKVIFLSAVTRMNLDELKKRLLELTISGNIQSEAVMISNVRHLAALNYVYSALQDVEMGLAENIPADLLSLDLRRSLQGIGEITGEVVNEEKLDFIFSKFCIGK